MLPCPFDVWALAHGCAAVVVDIGSIRAIEFARGPRIREISASDISIVSMLPISIRPADGRMRPASSA
jgi:hypothetical protein